MRGKARKDLGKYELALKDLSASQTIDFDEDTVQDLKFLAEKHVEMEKKEAEARVKEEEKLRKRAEEIKKAQAAAKKEASASAKASSSARGSGMGGMGGGMPGMPGGMPPGAADMMNDPELIAAMKVREDIEISYFITNRGVLHLLFSLHFYHAISFLAASHSSIAILLHGRFVGFLTM
jgi:hypothetical protein